MLISPSIQHISVFNTNIYIYGIILAFAIFIAISVTDFVAKKEYNHFFIYEQSFFIVILGLLGARLYYCLLNYHIYFENPLRILNFREGGISIHGAIITGIFVIYFFSKKYKFNFLKLCDLYALSLPLAQAIGRWGNFFNSEAYGLPTNSILKLYIAPKFRINEFMDFEYFHPTFLYESILNFLLFIFLYFFIFNKFKNNSGIITGLYLIFYSIIRIIIEPIRIDCTTYLLNIPFPVVISTLMLIFGLFIVHYSLSNQNSSSK